MSGRPKETKSLSSYLEDPSRIDSAPLEILPALQVYFSSLNGKCGEAQGRLAARLTELVNLRGSSPKYLSTEEASKLINMTPRWLNEHRKEIPGAEKISHKRIRYHRDLLLDWFERRFKG